MPVWCELRSVSVVAVSIVKHPAHRPATADAATIDNKFVFMSKIISNLGLTCHVLFHKILAMGKIWDKICQLLFIIAFAIVIVGGVMLSYPKYRQAQGLCRERDQILRRIEGKHRVIAMLRDRQRRFTTDREFVETLARENRRVFPNEIVFVFEN